MVQIKPDFSHGVGRAARSCSNLRIAAGAFLTVLLLAGCGGPCNPRTFKLRPTTLAYFGGFQEGSTWVYRYEQDTTLVDTLALQGLSRELVMLDGDRRRCKPSYSEELGYMLIGGAQPDTLWLRLLARSSDSFHLNGTYRGNALPLAGDVDGETNWFAASSYWNDELHFHGPMEIGGRHYEGVVQLRKPWGAAPERVPTFWLARGVGIVRFEQYDAATGARRTFVLQAYELR